MQQQRHGGDAQRPGVGVALGDQRGEPRFRVEPRLHEDGRVGRGGRQVGGDTRQAASLAKAKANDVVDALLALRARDGDTILTADPDDIRALLAAASVRATVVTT